VVETPEWLIADLPGYGFAQVSKSTRGKWSKLIDRYILHRENLMCTFLLLDIRHPRQENDREFMNQLGLHDIPFCILFTKSDKLKPAELEQALEAYKADILNEWELASTHCDQQPPELGRTKSLPTSIKRMLFLQSKSSKQIMKIYPPLIPNIKDWPINKLYEDREGLIETVDQQTVEYILEKHGDRIGDLISRVCYLELIRLKENPWKVDPPNEEQFWKRIRIEITANEKLKPEVKLANNTEVLKRIIHRYTTEIAGNFKESTFLFARKFLTLFFKRLLNAAAGKSHRRLWSTRLELYERLKIHGDIDHVRNMFQHGTVVILPTHLSNLDSILIGYALDSVVGFQHSPMEPDLTYMSLKYLPLHDPFSLLASIAVRRTHLPGQPQDHVSSDAGTWNKQFVFSGTRSRSGEIERVEIRIT
jgi:hypothetical protein